MGVPDKAETTKTIKQNNDTTMKTKKLFGTLIGILLVMAATYALAILCAVESSVGCFSFSARTYCTGYWKCIGRSALPYDDHLVPEQIWVATRPQKPWVSWVESEGKLSFNKNPFKCEVGCSHSTHWCGEPLHLVGIGPATCIANEESAAPAGGKCPEY